MRKVCVVAGVGPGNGVSLSRQFAAGGYTVVMLARNIKALAKWSESIPNSIALACDLSDPSAVETTFGKISDEIGPVETLVYNAGSGVWTSVMDTAIEDLRRAWATNVLGLLVSAQQIIPSMLEKQSGNIVVIGATASLRGGAQSTAFASAKAAQRSLAQSMARDLGPKGIHVGYVIIDGIIDLERTRARMSDKPDEFFMRPDAIAKSAFSLTQQDRSAWTFELDLRPFGERW